MRICPLSHYAHTTFTCVSVRPLTTNTTTTCVSVQPLTITTNTTCVSVSWVFLTAPQIVIKSKEKLLFDKERNEISTFSLLLFRRQPTRQNFSYDHETLSELKVQ